MTTVLLTGVTNERFKCKNDENMTYFTNNKWGNNQYQNLSDARSNYDSKVRFTISSIVLGTCFALIILLLCSMSLRETRNRTVIILDASQSLLTKTSERFLSYGLDSSLLRDMKNLPINDKRFRILARHLSPAYVRVGGTSADCLLFNQTLHQSDKIFNPLNGEDISNFTITDKDFLALGDFAQQSDARMIFDLNVLLRNSDGNWDYTDAKKIISIAKGHNLELDWQLGNEPNSFRHVFNRTVTAIQLASDYITLRNILDASGYESSNLIGPEVNHIGDVNHKGEQYAAEFLLNSENSVTYASWHQYYLNGREATVEDFVNMTVFNYLSPQIKSVANVINAIGKDVYMWISETSTAYGGGAPELSDRFVAGFLWLDKLGYSASVGVDVVTRQSFFGGNYALVSPDLTPNPDWWISVAYKQLVSNKVLQLITPNNFGLLRLYAHCTPESNSPNRVPAVTIYGVNLDKEPARIIVQSFFNPKLIENNNIYLYAFTADHLQSSSIKLNGKTLILEDNGELPPFVPIILDRHQTIVIPAYSMVFMVFDTVNVAACTD